MDEILENKLTRRYVYEFFWGFLVYTTLSGCLVHRYIKTRYVAKTKKPIYTLSIKLKIILTILQQIIYSIIIIASFTDSYMWFANRPGLSLCFMLPVAVLLLQEYFLLNDYNKKLPFVWYTHTLFWSLQSLTNVCLFIDTHLNESFGNITWTIDLVRCFTTIILLSIGAVKRQDIPGFEDSLTNPFKKSDFMESIIINNKSPKIVISRVLSQSRILEISSGSKKPLESSGIKNSEGIKSRTKLIFNCVIKRNIITVDNSEPKYQLNIEIGEKEQKLQKYKKTFTLKDVVIFLQHQANEFPEYIDSNQLSELRVAPGVSATKDMLEKKPIIERLLNKSIKNELFSKNFCSFFSVPEEYNKILKRKYKKKKAQNPTEENKSSEESLYNSEKSSFSIENANSLRKTSRVLAELAEESSINTQDIKRDHSNVNLLLTDLLGRQFNSDIEYCRYFYIRIREHVRNQKGNFIEYILELKIIENSDERWSCRKRFSDFLQLDHELKKNCTAPLPLLPGKGLMLTEKAYDDRKKGLEKYMRTILNEKVYFTTVLFDFIELKNDYYEGFLFEDPEKECAIKSRRAEFKETLLMVSEEDKQPFTAYNVKITEFGDQFMLKKLGCYQIIKRFSDFERLNKDLHVRFGSLRNFPIFPSKLEGLTTRSTINYRKVALEKFMNEIFLLENINDSYAFRKFIKFSPEAYENAQNTQSILIEKEDLDNPELNQDLLLSSTNRFRLEMNRLDDENLESLGLASNRFKS